MTQPRYTVRVNVATHMVQDVATGRFLAAFGTNFWRSWVYPLYTPLGGQVIGCLGGELRRGTADEVANGKACDAVAYESDVPGIGVYGICLMIRDNSASPDRRGPWFIRDYGMAMFNATQNASIAVPAGGAWTAALRVVAYDSALTAARLAAWKRW